MLHRAPIQPEVVRHGPRRPALVVHGPDLLRQRLPAGLVWRGALLRRPGHVVGRHRHGEGPIRERHRRLTRRRIDGGEDMTRRDEPLLQGVPEILEQMEAIRDLGGGGRPLAGALGIGAPAVPCAHLDAGMSLEPLGDGPAFRSGRRAMGWRRSRSMSPCPTSGVCGARNRPPQGPWGWAPLAQRPGARRVAACADSPPRPRRGSVACRPAPRAPDPGRPGAGRAAASAGPKVRPPAEPFREDAAPPGKVCTKPFADTSRPAPTIRCPRQLGQRAGVAAMDARGRHSADRTRPHGLGGGHRDG